MNATSVIGKPMAQCLPSMTTASASTTPAIAIDIHNERFERRQTARSRTPQKAYVTSSSSRRVMQTFVPLNALAPTNFRFHKAEMSNDLLFAEISFLHARIGGNAL